MTQHSSPELPGTTPSGDSLDSYDQLPYDSLPIPETEPGFLAAVARLHGIDTPDPDRARILELGCASGGNLIPIAARRPRTECIGIDLSRVQAESGARFVKTAGLDNVRILHGDILDLPAGLGVFDYILVHGVYSWVPDTVRAAILGICREHLSQQGVASISFNLASGWEAFFPLRAALRMRAQAGASPRDQVALARAALPGIARAFTGHGERLAREIDYLMHAGDAYLFHEYLTDIHRAEDFTEFVADLDQHGLRYAGDAGARHAVVNRDSAALWHDAEQALDERFEQRFRRALVRRADAPAALPPDASEMPRLAYAADVGCEGELDLSPGLEQTFIPRGDAPFAASQSMSKAALAVLSQHYPDLLGWDHMLDRARALLDECGQQAVEDDAFRAEWFALLMAQAIRVGIRPASRPQHTGERPRAIAFVRAQATQADVIVTGAHHEALDLDPPARALLQWLDGTRDRARLACEMRGHLATLGIETDADALASRTDEMLALFARHGLLES